MRSRGPISRSTPSVVLVTTIYYSTARPLTELTDVPSMALEAVTGTPVEICWPVHSLVIQPADAETLELPSHRYDLWGIRNGELGTRRDPR